MTRDELLAELTAERFGSSRWWITPPPHIPADDDLTCARRRRQLATAWTDDAKEKHA